MYYTPKQERNFWRKVEKLGGDDACWIWTAHRNVKGYGMFWFSPAMMLSHRVSWMLTNGEIPDRLQVLHKCDNPSCVNPSHLFLGTNDDNVRDKVEKGRESRGERVWQHKFTIDAVRAIRSRYAAGGITKKALADEYGVDPTTIGDMVEKRSWKHLLD